MMTDNSERAQVGWGFWLRWVLASTVGLAVGGTVGGTVGAVGTFFWGAGSENSEVGPVLIGFVIVAVSGAVFGASIGIAQTRVLRRKISRSGRWILASAAGGAASFAVAVAMIVNLDLLDLGFLSVSLDGEFLYETILGAVIVIGASLGIAQWLVLRRQVSRSGWWVLASGAGPVVISLVLFVVTVFALERIDVLPERSYIFGGFKDGKLIEVRAITAGPGAAIVAQITGVVGSVLGYGAITGGVMVWLYHQPQDMSNRRRLRSWLLSAAVLLIALMAVNFLFATTTVDEPIIERQAPPCSEASPVVPRVRPVTIITCQIDRAYCGNAFRLFGAGQGLTPCYDAPQQSSASFFLLAGEYDWSDLDGKCLLVTGEVRKGSGRTPFIQTYDRSNIEFCQ